MLQLRAFIILAIVSLLLLLMGMSIFRSGENLLAPALAASASVSSGNFLFKQIVMDANHLQYVIGEVDNPDVNNNIEAIVYFGKSNLDSANYFERIGTVPAGMGIPFKIALNQNGQILDPADIKIASFPTSDKPNDKLLINYTSLRMDPATHSISGMVNNDSPFASSRVKILAIALDSHSHYLDVVQSKTIAMILPNSSASFALYPMASIASNVTHYSCFVPTAAGENYTVTADNGQTIQLEIGGDGKIKNIHYDPSNHSISFTAEGIFPGGGVEEAMILSGPDSFTKSNLIVTVNGRNITNAVAGDIVSDNVYKHVEFSFPFGYNKVSIQAVSEVPEFPVTAMVMFAALSITLIITAIFVRRNNLYFDSLRSE